MAVEYYAIGKEALTALSRLMELIIIWKKKKNPEGISAFIMQMEVDVHQRALDLQRELQDMNHNIAILRDRRYNMDASLAEARRSGWFYKFAPTAPYRLLRNFGSRLEAISNQADNLFNDILAVANCQEAEDDVAQAIGTARDFVRELKDSANESTSIRGTVIELLKAADELVETTKNL